MQSVIKLMPEPIPEVPRDTYTGADTSTSQRDTGYDGRSNGFSQEFDNQINQYNDRNSSAGNNQQAHANFPDANSDRNGNHQSDDRQQMTAEELRELAKRAHETEKGEDKGNTVQKPPVEAQGKEDKGDTKPPVTAEAPKNAAALDSLVAMVEDAEKLIRTGGNSANIDSEFLKQNKLTDAMDKALIGKDADKRSVVDVLKGFTQAGSESTKDAGADVNGAGQTKESKLDPELAKLLGQTQSNSDEKSKVSAKQGDGIQNKELTAAGLQQGKAGGANLVIPGESESHQGPKSSDLLKILNGQSEAQSQAMAKVQAQLAKQNSEQQTSSEGGDGEQDMTIADFITANSSKGKKGENGASDDGQTKPMELAIGKDKSTKTEKPMELAGAGVSTSAVDEQSIAADEALKQMQSQGVSADSAGSAAEQVKVDGKTLNSAGQTIDTNTLRTHDKAAEHVNQQLAAQMNQANGDKQTSAQSATQAAAQSIVTGDKRQNILGKTANTKGGIEPQNTVNSEKLAQMAAKDAEQNQGEQQLSDGQTGSDGLFDELMQTSMPKDMPAANSKVASQFGQTFNQFSTDSAARLNATTQTLSATGSEKTPPQVTETLQMTRPDLSVNMKERMMLMMKNGVQTADIRLDPAELGQMQVKMSVENDVTSVSFIVQNSQAKELLEKALPQLKEMLAEQGVEMGESSVSQQDKQQEQLGDSEGNGQGQLASKGQQESEIEEDAIVQQVNITNGALGGIDYFA